LYAAFARCSWTVTLEAFNILFIVFFAAEATLKLLGIGSTAYFFEDWNKFDFVVVVISIIGAFISAGVGANVVRLLRVAR
jgi:hypothetical protein